MVQPDKYKPVPDEPPNPTNIEEILKSVRSDAKELEEVNLNNIQVFGPILQSVTIGMTLLTCESPSPPSAVPL